MSTYIVEMLNDVKLANGTGLENVWVTAQVTTTSIGARTRFELISIERTDLEEYANPCQTLDLRVFVTARKRGLSARMATALPSIGVHFVREPVDIDELDKASWSQVLRDLETYWQDVSEGPKHWDEEDQDGLDPSDRKESSKEQGTDAS